MTWDLCHPNALLSSTCEHCPHYRNQVAEALQRHPCSQERPWHLIFTFDEFVPGNPFDGANGRKTMALLFTFAELGRRCLADPRTWMIPVTVRTSAICSVVGGWSAMFAAYLHLHLFGNSGITTHGCPVILNGGSPALIWAKLAVAAADGDGLKQTLDWKGAVSYTHLTLPTILRV